LQDTRSGRLYSYCFCLYKSESIKDLMGRLNQCAADLGLQQIIDTRVDAADMIQHVLKEFVGQSDLIDKEREKLRTDTEKCFQELTAELGEIENKSASQLKEIFANLEVFLRPNLAEVKENLIDTNFKLDRMILAGTGITTINITDNIKITLSYFGLFYSACI
jgi:polyhydroxyalkanoate synthesis regulator phasin